MTAPSDPSVAEVLEPHCGAMASIMLAGEEDCGRQGVWPHHKRRPKWFHAEDWSTWPVIAHDEAEVHIVAVWSARKGALSRLVREVRAARLVPVIVEPMGDMLNILARWDWERRVSGEGWGAREEWRPRPRSAANLARREEGK